MSLVIILIIGIIFLVLVLVLIAIIFMIYQKISRKIKSSSKEFAQLAWGTDSISEGVEKMQWEYSTTPKSVAAATNFYLPVISNDFPDFHYEEMKARAENVLVSYFRAIDAMDAKVLEEGTEELKDKLHTYLAMLRQKGAKEHFERIHIHRTEIMRYTKGNGKCTIVFQSAIEYLHYVEVNGKLKSGNKELKEQGRYNIELIYIQDRDVVEDIREASLGMHCPNCGAPIKKLGEKYCEYCGSHVVQLNIKTWNFSKISKA